MQIHTPTIYRILPNASNISFTDTERVGYNDLGDLFTALYAKIFNTRNLKLSDVQLVCYSMNIPVTVFNFCYDDGLVMFSEKDRIKVRSIWPQYTSVDFSLNKIFTNSNLEWKELDQNNWAQELDKIISKQELEKINLKHLLDNLNGCNDIILPPTNKTVSKCSTTPNTTNQSCSTRIPNVPSQPVISIPQTIIQGTPIPPVQSQSKTEQRHTKMLDNAKNILEKAQAAQDTSKKEEVKAVLKKAQFDEPFEEKKEKERNEKIIQNRSNEKIRVFESDKKSYLQIKNDLEKGLLKREEMHPYFILKYPIFKVLEARNAINFTSNDNIVQEYNLFSDLHDYDYENDCPKSEVKPVNTNVSKVYVPHNYNYMTIEQQEKHAAKYRMTRKQFEEKYVSGLADDDDIENHILLGTTNIPKKESLVVDNSSPQNETQQSQINKVITIDVNNDTPNCSDTDDSDDSDTDTDDSDLESRPKVDLNFLKLTQEYNKRLN